jgi:hypothetical protein
MLTQGVTKVQVVEFWYGILDKEFRHQVQDVILLQPTQPTSTNVFQLSKRIEMNMVEE